MLTVGEIGESILVEVEQYAFHFLAGLLLTHQYNLCEALGIIQNQMRILEMEEGTEVKFKVMHRCLVG